MTVTFADTDTRLGIDDTLRPLLARARNSAAPDGTLLALLCRGLTLGFQPREIGAAVKRLDKQLGALVGSPRYWRLLSSARRTVASSTSAAGAQKLRLQVSRRVVSRLLNPTVPAFLGPRAEVSVRITFGVVGGIFLREVESRQFSAIILTSGYLAAQLGLTQRQAVRQLKALRDLGWISITTPARGGAARYRLPRLSGIEGAIAHGYGDTIDSLASGTPDLLGEALKSALHPAFHYGARGELDSRAWLALGAHRAGVGHLGLSQFLAHRAQKAIETYLPGVWEGDTNLAASLDAYAETSGANTRKAEAEIVLAQAAVVHRAQLADLMEQRAAEKELRASARAILKRAWATVGGVPKPDAGEGAIQAWAAGAKGLFDSHPVPEVLAETVPETLRGQLAWHGYSPEVAARIAGYIFPGLP